MHGRARCPCTASGTGRLHAPLRSSLGSLERPTTASDSLYFFLPSSLFQSAGISHILACHATELTWRAAVNASAPQFTGPCLPCHCSQKQLHSVTLLLFHVLHAQHGTGNQNLDPALERGCPATASACLSPCVRRLAAAYPSCIRSLDDSWNWLKPASVRLFQVCWASGYKAQLLFIFVVFVLLFFNNRRDPEREIPERLDESGSTFSIHLRRTLLCYQ